MKTRIFFKTAAGCALAFSMLFLSGCAKTYVTQNFSEPGFSPASLKDSKSVLMISKNTSVLEFRQSFEATFRTGDSLARYLSKRISDSLPDANISVRTEDSVQAIAEVLDGNTLDLDQIAVGRARLKALDCKYLIYVKNPTVSNSLKSSPGFATTYGGAHGTGVGMTAGGTSEMCHASFDVDIWEPATLKKVASFHVTGSASVFMFAYQTTLISAVNRSADHLVGYILRNQTTGF